MDVSKHQKYLVAGSSDFLIKIATLKDMNQCGVFSGHDAPVLSVQVSPDERNLVSNGVYVAFVTRAWFRLWDILTISTQYY